MEFSILDGVLILLSVAVVIVIMFRRINLPPILGYLFVGLLVGPYGLGWIPETQATHELAEFGVVFLMFTIGLEFSLSKLIAMRGLVLGLGGLQVLITTAVTVGIAMIFGQTLNDSIVIGSIVAMSSTAIVIKQLTDQLELNTSHGENAVGILLFQDLAVIPFLILIPSLGAGPDAQPILMPLVWAMGKGAAAMLLILAIGRWILRPVFHEIAASRSMELFTLSVLLVTLAAAWLTEDMGLSLALGAFLAGMMLGETEFRHQVEANIRPFRDVLLGLFFITIGMLLNIRSLPDIWQWVLLLLFVLIVVKTLVIFGLCRLLGNKNPIALRTGLVLAHGGEFGFALLSLAMAGNILKPELSQIVLGAILFSMLLSPLMIRYSGKLVESIFPEESGAETDENVVKSSVEHAAHGLEQHVIICGYGRVGQNIARLLESEGIEYIAMDLDPSRVQNAQLAGDRVTYGDSTNLEMLAAAGLKFAKALVISFEDVSGALKILQQVRKYKTHMPILVRARDDAELSKLQENGATEVIPATLEASLAIASHLLVFMGIPPSRVLRITREARGDRYKLLRQIFPDQESIALDEGDPDREQLMAVNLPKGSYAIGHNLGELDLDEANITVTAIRRGGIRGPAPEPETELRADDVLVLCGSQTSLNRAEKLLLEG